jgi:sugar phosphate isomerase/epimerase
MTRRHLLQSGLALAQSPAGKPTNFQIACMTLPYAAFPLERALEGIANSGYRYVAWGTTHQKAPLLAVDAPPAESRRLAERCRGIGLEPVMMFSTVQLEAPDAGRAHALRIAQAAAAKIPYLLTFGKTSPGEYDRFIANLRRMAPLASGSGVTVVIKQHGGNSATGAACARILQEVGDEAIKICYDAGNVLDYENADPIADIKTCWRDVRAFAIKDHRNWPKDEDCGPGFGEIDHYKLLAPVARTGLTIPLACENIFEPLVARPAAAEGVDVLARRAREFLETVIRGIQS